MNRKNKTGRKLAAIARFTAAAAGAAPLALSVPPLVAAADAPVVLEHMSDALAGMAANLQAGKSVTIDLADIFRDADGLEFHVAVQNPSVAKTSFPDRTTLRLDLRKQGTTAVVLKANMPGQAGYAEERFAVTVAPNAALSGGGDGFDIGDLVSYFKAHPGEFKSPADFRNLLHAAVESTVTEPNKAPRPLSVLPSVSVEEEERQTIHLSDYFGDDDGDALEYSLVDRRTDPHYSVDLDESTGDLTVRGLAPTDGALSLSVQAGDGEAAVAQTMSIVVMPGTDVPPPVNHPPVVDPDNKVGVNNDGNMTLRTGAYAGQQAVINLHRVFADEDGDELTFDYDFLGDSALYLQQEDILDADGMLKLVPSLPSGGLPGSSGVTALTVRASDDGGETWVEHELHVTVMYGDIGDISLSPLSRDPFTLNLTDYFDLNGDGAASFDVSDSRPDYVSYSWNEAGDTLSLRASQPGRSQMAVIQDDGHGGKITDPFDTEAGLSTTDIGTVYLNVNGEAGASAGVDLRTIFDDATEFRVLPGEGGIFTDWNYEANDGWSEISDLRLVAGNWSPDMDNIASDITIEGRNAMGDEASYALHVETNHAPAIEEWGREDKPVVIGPGESTRDVTDFEAEFTDRDGDPLTYSGYVDREVQGGNGQVPGMLQVSPEGMFSFNATEYGEYTLHYSASDDKGGESDEVSVPLFVADESAIFDYDTFEATIDLSAYLEDAIGGKPIEYTPSSTSLIRNSFLTGTMLHLETDMQHRPEGSELRPFTFTVSGEPRTVYILVYVPMMTV